MRTKKWLFLPYTAVMMACYLYAGIRGSHYPGVRCLFDVMCDVGYYGSRLLIPFTMLGIMLFFHEDFRVGVLLRYRNISCFLCHMIKKNILFSVGIAILQTIFAIICSLFYTQLMCNWNQTDSYAANMYGVILPERVLLWRVAAWYFYVMLMQTAVVAAVLCLFWWLTQTSVSGFATVLVLLVLEAFPLSGTELFFNVVSTREINVLLNNFSTIFMVIYPLGLLTAAYGCMATVLCNRDYLRFG